MKMLPVSSSNIVAIGYENGTMHVQFKSGTYRYDNVSALFHKELMNYPSKGAYLSRSGLKGTRISN